MMELNLTSLPLRLASILIRTGAPYANGLSPSGYTAWHNCPSIFPRKHVRAVQPGSSRHCHGMKLKEKISLTLKTISPALRGIFTRHYLAEDINYSPEARLCRGFMHAGYIYVKPREWPKAGDWPDQLRLTSTNQTARQPFMMNVWQMRL